MMPRVSIATPHGTLSSAAVADKLSPLYPQEKGMPAATLTAPAGEILHKTQVVWSTTYRLLAPSMTISPGLPMLGSLAKVLIPPAEVTLRMTPLKLSLIKMFPEVSIA